MSGDPQSTHFVGWSTSPSADPCRPCKETVQRRSCFDPVSSWFLSPYQQRSSYIFLSASVVPVALKALRPAEEPVATLLHSPTPVRRYANVDQERNSVGSHLYRLLRKLGVEDRQEPATFVRQALATELATFWWR